MSTLPVETGETDAETLPLSAEGLLRRRAQQRPGVAALGDPPNLQALGLGHPRFFTYRETDGAVDALASLFVALGLVPGDIVAVQLPNVAASPLTLIAAWRAGLTVAALPMLWREYEIGRACEAIAPKALIGVARFSGEAYAEKLCTVAATQLSVRFVLGYGADLPDGVISLDPMLEPAGDLPDCREAQTDNGPAMITFTARPGAVLALALDRSDVILNPYPLTGPVGLALGLMPWLIGGATLVQHHPFDYASFVEQLFATGASVTAIPSPVLDELAKDGVPERSGLRRLGIVWPTPEMMADAPPVFHGAAPLLFDVYPLGDLASLVLRREARHRAQPIPLGPVRLDEDGADTVFVETRLGTARDADDNAELLLRGPIVPSGMPEAPDDSGRDGFVGTGLRSALAPSGSLRFKANPELLRHGGIAIATSEFDELYRSYPGFLDAACFVLPDPVIGDRIFAAAMPRPGEPVSHEALNRFLAARGVAPYKLPDKVVVVKQIPRDADGRILRDRILKQV